MKKKRFFIIALTVLASLTVIGAATVFGINAYVKGIGGDSILSAEEAAELNDVDCIVVLGCMVKSNGKPSDMLEDRLRRGIELYEAGAAPKIIMSGDHGAVYRGLSRVFRMEIHKIRQLSTRKIRYFSVDGAGSCTDLRNLEKHFPHIKKRVAGLVFLFKRSKRKNPQKRLNRAPFCDIMYHKRQAPVGEVFRRC